MSITKYEVLNPITDNKRPFIKNGRLFFNINFNNYKYYLECAINNKDTNDREYYLLMSDSKFDKNCKKCNVDNYGRYRIYIKGELKEYIENEIKSRGNINIDYMESEENYDVFSVI